MRFWMNLGYVHQHQEVRVFKYQVSGKEFKESPPKIFFKYQCQHGIRFVIWRVNTAYPFEP